MLDKNAIPPVGMVDEHMGHCPNQLAVLKDGAAAHE